MIRVVNLRKEPFTVYIGRAGKGKAGTYGNPFIVGRDGERGECVKLFESWFYSAYGSKMRKLVEKIPPDAVLGCFCKPAACHGDVIAHYLNNKRRTRKAK